MREGNLQASQKIASIKIWQIVSRVKQATPQDGEPPTIVLRGAGDEDARDTSGASVSCVSVGDVLKARFQLVELIGEGGMGRVFKALDLRRVESGAAQPHVAVKVLTLVSAQPDSALAALQREAQQLQVLSHPNIVRVFDCDRDGTTVFMTMEYLVGHSLYQELVARPPTGGPALERSHARRVIAAIADALDFAHQRGIVHGDVKPGNVFVTDSGEFKVVDFGVARWVTGPNASDRTSRDATPSARISAVTPRYASPQLLAGHPAEIADDVYAFAGLAYQLLTGTLPFGPKGAVPGNRAPPARGLTSGEHAALVHALQFDAGRRTQTMREFLKEFRPEPARSSGNSRIAWGVASVAVGALVLTFGWYAGRPAEPRSPPPLAPAPAARLLPAAPSKPEAGSLLHDCAVCPLVTVVPSGVFQQGADNSDLHALASEKPAHRVGISLAFGLSTTEVTVAEFRAFVNATRRSMRGCDVYEGRWRYEPRADWENPGFAQSATHPVTCVSWEDASAYAAWLSTQSGQRYRLPSASEWEYAARAGGLSGVPWGSAPMGACAVANVADQSARERFPGWTTFGCADGFINTAPVGSFQANAYGLQDLFGNVFEWTEDCWHSNYVGAPEDGTARMDPPCTEHELRGGSWFSSPNYVRAAYRDHFAANYRTSTVGIRLARDLSE